MSKSSINRKVCITAIGITLLSAFTYQLTPHNFFALLIFTALSTSFGFFYGAMATMGLNISSKGLYGDLTAEINAGFIYFLIMFGLPVIGILIFSLIEPSLPLFCSGIFATYPMVHFLKQIHQEMHSGS